MLLDHRDGKESNLEVIATQLVVLLPFNWKSNVISQ